MYKKIFEFKNSFHNGNPFIKFQFINNDDVLLKGWNACIENILTNNYCQMFLGTKNFQLNVEILALSFLGKMGCRGKVSIC